MEEHIEKLFMVSSYAEIENGVDNPTTLWSKYACEVLRTMTETT